MKLSVIMVKNMFVKNHLTHCRSNDKANKEYRKRNAQPVIREECCYTL